MQKFSLQKSPLLKGEGIFLSFLEIFKIFCKIFVEFLQKFFEKIKIVLNFLEIFSVFEIFKKFFRKTGVWKFLKFYTNKIGIKKFARKIKYFYNFLIKEKPPCTCGAWGVCLGVTIIACGQLQFTIPFLIHVWTSQSSNWLWLVFANSSQEQRFRVTRELFIFRVH